MYEYMGAELNLIKTRNDAIRFMTCFNEFGIGSYVADVTHIWFRYEGYGSKISVNDYDIGYTIDHEIYGYVKASLKEVIDYIYRNRKYINAWIKDIALKSDKSDHFALENEMKVIEY